jgi:hypothetical protein
LTQKLSDAGWTLFTRQVTNLLPGIVIMLGSSARHAHEVSR